MRWPEKRRNQDRIRAQPPRIRYFLYCCIGN